MNIEGWREGGVLISAEQIEKRVRELGEQISADYRGKEILAVGVLKGAFIFMADLVRNIEDNVKLDFISASSYGSSDNSSGVIKINKDLNTSPKGKDILLIEDIADTGNTLSYLKDVYFPGKGASSVKICALLDKPARRVKDLTLDYCGFTIEDRFVVGYGLDYAEYGRNLPDIRYLVKETLVK